MTWQPRLDRVGERVEGVEELEQAIEIIYTTPLRSVPLLPWLGSEFWKLIDLPLPEFRRRAPVEAQRCIKRCEPRIKIVDVTTVLNAEQRPRVLTKWRPTTPLNARERASFRTTAVDF